MQFALLHIVTSYGCDIFAEVTDCTDANLLTFAVKSLTCDRQRSCKTLKENCLSKTKPLNILANITPYVGNTIT